MAKAKLKSKAQIYVPQSRDEVAADIRKIGDLQRDIARHEAEMNDKIAALTQDCQTLTSAMCESLMTLQKGVQAYCEAHRDELTRNGKVKSANLVTGEVQWRQRPPSVKITGVDAVVEALKRFKLVRFLRMKIEINKEAILNEPKAVEGVPGIKIVTGLEDFVIEPFEQEVAQ